MVAMDVAKMYEDVDDLWDEYMDAWIEAEYQKGIRINRAERYCYTHHKVMPLIDDMDEDPSIYGYVLCDYHKKIIDKIKKGLK